MSLSMKLTNEKIYFEKIIINFIDFFQVKNKIF